MSRYKSLVDTVDIGFKNHINIDQSVLREVLARALAHPDAEKYMHDIQKTWPEWTNHVLTQAVLLSIARKNGNTGSFLEVYLSLKQKKPNQRSLPLDAWTVLNTWLSENGPQTKTTLPTWVWNYFVNVAYDIQKLRVGYVVKSNFKNKLGSNVLNALKFVSNRSNIFNADHDNFRNAVAYVFWCANHHKGLRGDTLISAVQNLVGDADSRTTRRRIAKGKSATSDPPWLNSKD